MSLLILDDGILDHAKFIRATRAASSAAVHLWLGLMIYCKQQLTDGLVPIDVVSDVHGPVPRWRARALEALIDAKLIERVDASTLRVHGYLDRNDSREEIERKSAARRAGAKRRRDVDPTTTRQPSDDDPTTTRRPPDAAPTTDRRQAVSNDNDVLSARVPTLYVTDPIRTVDGNVDPPNPQGGSEPSAQSASTTGRKPGKRSKPPSSKTLCPADLKPDPTTAAKAWELGFDDEQLRLEVEDFIDWWTSAKRPMGDWQATLRNRLRAQAKHYGLAPRKPRDEKWEVYQREKAAAETPPIKRAPRPAGYESMRGGLFGG